MIARVSRLIFGSLLFSSMILAPAGSELRAAQGPAAMLVIPARFTVVQLALDVAGKKPICIVAYDKGRQPGTHIMHRWDGAAGQWQPISDVDFAAGTPWPVLPPSVFIVGLPAEMPSLFANQPAWCDDIIKVESLAIAPLINSLNERLAFSPSDWRWFADKYKLQIKDLNEERRRYGKYGKPGSQPTPAGHAPQGDIAPARMTTETRRARPEWMPPVAAPTTQPAPAPTEPARPVATPTAVQHTPPQVEQLPELAPIEPPPTPKPAPAHQEVAPAAKPTPVQPDTK